MSDKFPEKLKFCYWGNPILREKAVKVENPESPETQEFIEKMRLILEEHDGLGLAANQVNCNRRVCLAAFPKEGEYPEMKVLINPVILEKSKKTVRREEGCLSFPGIYKDIDRPGKIKVKAYITGEGERIFEAEELLARIICHEVDHLNGVVFIDHLSYLSRSLLKKELKRIAEKKNIL